MSCGKFFGLYLGRNLKECTGLYHNLGWNPTGGRCGQVIISLHCMILTFFLAFLFFLIYNKKERKERKKERKERKSTK